jgi:hypothetical protein
MRRKKRKKKEKFFNSPENRGFTPYKKINHFCALSKIKL